MGRKNGIRNVVFVIVVACTAGGLTACGGSEPTAVRTITSTTEDGQTVVTEEPPDDEPDDGDGNGEDDGDELPGCFGAGSGPPEQCRRAPRSEDECIDVRDEADAAIATITDENQLAAARLARGVALLCLDERLDEAREDIEFAQARRDDLNDFSQETLEQIDVQSPPTGPGEIQDVLQDADAGASSG